ncbi:MAG: hypothetical protein AAGU07_09330 [Methanobacterium sp.]
MEFVVIPKFPKNLKKFLGIEGKTIVFPEPRNYKFRRPQNTQCLRPVNPSKIRDFEGFVFDGRRNPQKSKNFDFWE